jgi:hypothetical protein
MGSNSDVLVDAHDL